MSTPRILIVEDEMLIALLLENVVEDLGYEVLGPAHQLDTALRLADSEPLSLALLDVNLGAHTSQAVADRLRERGLPYLFLTGYGEKGLPPGHTDAPVLAKPFKLDDLAQRMQMMLGRDKEP